MEQLLDVISAEGAVTLAQNDKFSIPVLRGLAETAMHAPAISRSRLVEGHRPGRLSAFEGTIAAVVADHDHALDEGMDEEIRDRLADAVFVVIRGERDRHLAPDYGSEADGHVWLLMAEQDQQIEKRGGDPDQDRKAAIPDEPFGNRIEFLAEIQEITGKDQQHACQVHENTDAEGNHAVEEQWRAGGARPIVLPATNQHACTRPARQSWDRKTRFTLR